MSESQENYFDLPHLIQQAGQYGPDMRVAAEHRAGEYVPPPCGLAGARLVGYFELGTHEEEFEEQIRDREKIDLVFELSGPNYEPRKLDDGAEVPHRITVQETFSLTSDANFFKLFAAMNAAHGGQGSGHCSHSRRRTEG